MIPREVVVVGEHAAGELTDITLEMLAGARELARSVGWQVTCLILAEDPKPFEALPLNADKIIIVTDPSLAAPNPTAYSRVLPHLLKDLAPRVVFLGNTSLGIDLAGPLSYELGIPAIGGCVSIRAEGDRITVTSRLCGGKLRAQTEQGEGMAIVLVMPGSFHRDLGMQDVVPPHEVRASPAAAGPLLVRFIELIEPKAEDIDVTKIPVLVAAGRGVQSKENLAMVEDLA